MGNSLNQKEEKNLKIAGICGLYCGGCTVYIGTKEDPHRLGYLANRTGQRIEELKCEGCRSNRLSGYCKTCHMKECAREKGVDFCGDCESYPCEEIKNFQKELPHRWDLFESMTYLKKNGLDKWYEQMKEDYSCKSCGETNSAYDLKCRKCGNTPGNDFVKRNGEWIIKVLLKRSNG